MRHKLFVFLSVVTVGCGTEPGLLMVTVNDVPQFIIEPSVTIVGSVTRDPPKETPIVVTIAGGFLTVLDTLDGSNFSLPVTLKEDQENQLAVTASDGTGAISQPVIVVVTQDATGPTIASATPGNRFVNVALDTPIQVRFAEPLVQSGPNASIALKQNSRSVPGTPAISGDSTLVTFQPDQPLEPHSIYELEIDGFTDEAGNLPGDGVDFCFITTSVGLDTAMTVDTANSFFSEGTITTLDTIDIIGATLARSGSTLYGLFEFRDDRTLRGDVDKASIIMDIDLDGNPATGFKGFKDVIFDTNFPELSSGMGAEMVVSLDAHGVIADSAFVGVNDGDGSWIDIDVFLPGVCGPFFGFHTTTILGDSVQDNGNFSYVYTAVGVEDPLDSMSGIYADPVPVSDHFDATLTDPGPVPFAAWRIPSAPVGARRMMAPDIAILRRTRGRQR